MSAEANDAVIPVIADAAGQPISLTVGTTTASRNRAATAGPSVDTEAGSRLPEPAVLIFKLDANRFINGKGAMQTLYQQKILDVKTNHLYRYEVFFAEECQTTQTVSPMSLGGDGRLFPFKEMISHLLKVVSGFPDEIQHLISINVSNTILLDAEMLDVFLEQLEDLPYGLSIEVTPLGEFPEPRKLNAVFSELRKLNCSVEFDDFGGPNSQNPQILSEYSFDSVKLNSTFVQTALSDQRRMRLLALVTTMIKAQGKRLIATGVSTCTQSEKLASLGIVLQQGDFIHSPELVS
jgi:hypothetical protein